MDTNPKSVYHTNGTKLGEHVCAVSRQMCERQRRYEFFTFWGLLPLREGRCFACYARREVKTLITYDSIMVMLAIGIFLVSLIRLIIDIIKNMKK